MRNKIESRKNFIINVLYFALVAALVYCTVKYVLGWILPFLFGLIVALILKPSIRFISKKLRISRKLTAVILALLFYVVVGILLFWAGSQIIQIIKNTFIDAPTIYTHYIQPFIQDMIDRLQELTARLDPNMAKVLSDVTNSLPSSAGALISSLSSKVIRYLSTTVISLPGFLLSVLFAVISSVFFAMDYELIKEYAKRWLPEKAMDFIVKLKIFLVRIVFKYVKSYLILMSVTFVELSIGLLIFGIKSAIGIAALIAIIDMLPVLGTGGVVIPWILIDLIMGNYTLSVKLLVLYVIIIIVRNILEPKIVGQQIGVHPLVMLISMYVGLKIFGFIGIFLLPITIVVVKGFYDSGYFRSAGQDAPPASPVKPSDIRDEGHP